MQSLFLMITENASRKSTNGLCKFFERHSPEVSGQNTSVSSSSIPLTPLYLGL